MTELLLQLPLWWAKAISALLFLAIIVLVWSMPKRFVLQGAPDSRGWRDLRIWATVLILVQCVLYALF